MKIITCRDLIDWIKKNNAEDLPIVTNSWCTWPLEPSVETAFKTKNLRKELNCLFVPDNTMSESDYEVSSESEMMERYGEKALEHFQKFDRWVTIGD